MPKTLLRLALPALAALLALPALASADVRFTTDRFSADEGAGVAVISVVRDDARGSGQVRYGSYYDRSAEARQDWRQVSGRIDFAPGQTEGSFTVPLIDDDFVEGPETIKVGIYGSHPEKLGEPNRAKLTIVDNDSVATPDARDPVNPLGLDVAPTDGNPLHGARFFVDDEWGLAKQAMRKHPSARAALQVIADQPETKRFGTWTNDPRDELATYLQRVQAADPGAIPLVATYRLKHLQCGGVTDSPADVESYKRWYDQFAAGVGNSPVVLFYEIDALITTRCLSREGLNRRTEEVRYAIDVLSRLPRAVVYVDAGSGLAHAPRYVAYMLRRVGVGKIQGFFTNATHQNRTRKEIAYARTLRRLVGGAKKPHFVINTAVNGRGPLVPKSRVRDGNSYRCNAPGRGLGPKPTSDVPAYYGGLDGFFWIGNPGRSAGACAEKLYPPGTVPPTGTFWLDYALELVRFADFRIT